MRSRVLRYERPRELLLDTVEVPEPRPGDALVRMLSCGVCGTDLHIYEEGWRGVPGMTLGHEFSAEVVAAPGVEGVSEGDRVVVNPTLSCGHCRACTAGQQHLCHERRGVIGITEGGAFADYVLVPGARLGIELLHVPDGVSDDAAALTEPLAVGLHAVELSQVEPDDHAIVYGAGTIGLCVTRWLAVEGVRGIVVVDPLPMRRQAALVQGATAALDPHDELFETALSAELTGARRPGKADVAIECAGAPGLLADAMTVLAPGGRLTVAAVIMGDDTLSSMRVLFKELTVRGAMSYNGPDFARALEHVAEWGQDVESLVSHRFGLSQVLEAFRAQADRAGSLKVMVQRDDPA